MTAPRYETHKPDPLLPFVYHYRCIARQREYTLNLHEQVEILQCISGSGYVRYDAEYLRFTPGTVIVVNPNVVHVAGSAQTVEYRCLIIDNSFFLANGIPVESLSFQQSFQNPAVFSTLEAIAADYLQLKQKRDDYLNVLAIRTHMQHLVWLLCRDHTARQVSPTAGGYVTQATEYLKKNMASHIGLDDVAAAVGISKYHLARQFKALTGKSILQTLNLMRCAHARHLIQEGHSVSEAAAASGFENLPHFTCTFKKCFGRLPSEYLSQGKQSGISAK